MSSGRVELRKIKQNRVSRTVAPLLFDRDAAISAGTFKLADLFRCGFTNKPCRLEPDRFLNNHRCPKQDPELLFII